jgi:hypothetical protein
VRGLGAVPCKGGNGRARWRQRRARLSARSVTPPAPAQQGPRALDRSQRPLHSTRIIVAVAFQGPGSATVRASPGDSQQAVRWQPQRARAAPLRQRDPTTRVQALHAPTSAAAPTL